MSEISFQIEIENLIALGYEGGYWDYKKDYSVIEEDKLIDIICMANNLYNRDAYIIYGVTDNGEIVGIENTKQVRMKTADVIKFLRSRKFSGDNIPEVEVRTLKIGNHEVDVLTVFRSDNTPFFLSEEFCNPTRRDKMIRAGAIYTRTADINTPRESTANIEVTEYLWKKRFGYDLQPFDRYMRLLDDYRGWSEANWDTVRYKYYKMHPEYKISVGESREGYETLRFFYDNPIMFYAELHLDYYGTTLFETELWYMDEGGCIIPQPKYKSIGYSDYGYNYFVFDSVEGKILNFITNGKKRCHDRSGLDVPVLLFNNGQEIHIFEEYFKNINKKSIIEEVSNNAIIQHKINEEERVLKGKPVSGVLEMAICYEIYKKWRREERIGKCKESTR